jgi:hypothetical protein
MATLSEAFWDEYLPKLDAGMLSQEEEHRFLERLTFSSFEEITTMLAEMYSEKYLDMPVWIRNLAYRLACLLEPENPKILREAAYDLFSFGPDWDQEAARLNAKAALLEGETS